MEVIGQLRVLAALTPGRYILTKKLSDSQCLSRGFGEETNLLHQTGFEPGSSSPQRNNYTDWAILAPGETEGVE